MRFSINFVIFSMLLSSAFRQVEECVYLHRRSNGKLEKQLEPREIEYQGTYTNLQKDFADDAALTTYTEHNLQKLIS